jgi:nucleoside-diphosphate-sugar epimerase
VAIYPPANGLRQPVHALDVADAALAIIDNPKTYGKAYNLGGNEGLPYRQMLERIFKYLGKKPRLIPIPFLPQVLDAVGTTYQFGYINGEMARRMNRDIVFDIKEAAEDFGYHPQGFLEGDTVL